MSCELKRWTRYAVMMSSDIMKWLLKNCIKKLRLRSSVLRRRVFDVCVCVCLLWMLSLSHTHTHSGWHHALLSSGVVWLWLFVLQRCSLSPHLHISPDGVVETPSRSLLIDFTPLPGPRPQVCMFWCAAAALAHDLTAPSKRCFTSTLTTARRAGFFCRARVSGQLNCHTLSPHVHLTLWRVDQGTLSRENNARLYNLSSNLIHLLIPLMSRFRSWGFRFSLTVQITLL